MIHLKVGDVFWGRFTATLFVGYHDVKTEMIKSVTERVKYCVKNSK
jgi:hypothetical protein